jgi:hypothetical protein
MKLDALEKWEARMKEKDKKELAERKKKEKEKAERLRQEYLRRTGRKEMKP